MSEYRTTKTIYKDKKCLLAALAELGFTADKVEDHAEAQHLYGYQGDKRSQKAHIIIRREHVGGASNDIGFAKQADGTYEAIISQYDQGRYNKAWNNKLTQHYNVNVTIKKAKAKGLEFRKIVKGDEILLTTYR